RGEILIGNFIAPTRPGAGIADARDAYGETEFYFDLNLRLLQRLKATRAARLFDLDRLAARYGKDRAHQARMFHLAKMDWSQSFLPTVADELARHLNAIRGRTRKCLVVDLDNTLWGGVVGEDGTGGVKIGAGDPVGEAYLALQQRIRALQSRGVILAVCSKNNPEDALAVFDERDEMELKRDDFAEMAINWEGKPQNLQRIASALNIGLDSLVFMDDNPAEIAMVEAALPQVETLLLSGDPSTFAGRLDGLTVFEKSVILEDDRTKTRQYRENRDRETLREEIGDLREYLASLEMRLTIRPAEEVDLPRLEQLFQKTNQFNLTTRRHARADLERFMQDPATELRLFSAADRFGAMGIIGAYVLCPAEDEDELEIESFLMSCRAMGRGIETEVMNGIKRRLLDEAGVSAIRARFIPTRKNVPVRSFFEEQGFQAIEKDSSGETMYRLTEEECSLTACSWIEVDA
ncbi:MAG: HAD-IIIC family phosphatase, partial [Gemmatimonadota bacterium]